MSLCHQLGNSENKVSNKHASELHSFWPLAFLLFKLFGSGLHNHNPIIPWPPNLLLLLQGQEQCSCIQSHFRSDLVCRRVVLTQFMYPWLFYKIILVRQCSLRDILKTYWLLCCYGWIVQQCFSMRVPLRKSCLSLNYGIKSLLEFDFFFINAFNKMDVPKKVTWRKQKIKFKDYF